MTKSKGDRWAAPNDMPLTHSDPWRRGTVGAVDGGTGKYTSNSHPLTSKPSDTLRDDPWGEGKTKDIYDDVCKNSLDDDAGGSRPGPIRYGTGK
jgi:hypothetical protein